MTRANALHALGRHHEIVADMGELQKTFQNDKQVEHCINRAQFELRKAARPDYYGLLGTPLALPTLPAPRRRPAADAPSPPLPLPPVTPPRPSGDYKCP